MTAVVSRDKPRWRAADPAQVEIWISEFHDGQYAAGLRLRAASMGSGRGQPAAGPGALPPTVAAAMVDLAGRPGAAGPARTLLDPCCGAGTILAEALAAGWAAEGTDISESAVAAAGPACARPPSSSLATHATCCCLTHALPPAYRGCHLDGDLRAAGEWQDFAGTATDGDEQGHAQRRRRRAPGERATAPGDSQRASSPAAIAHPAARHETDDLGVPSRLMRDRGSGPALAADDEVRHRANQVDRHSGAPHRLGTADPLGRPALDVDQRSDLE